MTETQRGTMIVLRPGDCQHPTVTDAQLIEAPNRAVRYWDSNEGVVLCPDCGEHLYPEEDPEQDAMVAYVGEPKHAGDDPWGRPSPVTHPEYWTE